MKYQKLGELLTAAGAITEEELQKGLEIQKQTKERLGAALIHSGIITEMELIEALQMQLGIEYVDLSKVSIPAELAQALPKNIAKQYQVVPVRVVGDEIYLAMSDPLNFYALEEVKKSVKKRVVPVVSTAGAIDHAIQVLYSNEGAAKAIEEMKHEAGLSGKEEHTSAFVPNQLGEDGADSAPAIRLVNSIIERGIMERASDIHFEPQETEMKVRLRVDGLMRDILAVPKDLQAAVISRIKVMAGMDIAEHNVPLDGRFNVHIKDKNIDVRLSSLPTIYGEKMVARLLDKDGRKINVEEIGLKGEDLEKYRRMISAKSGVILIVGPTGSGKTTTMYTMIDELNQREVNLVTLEDPVEYNFEGVNQVQINEKVGMTFANGLRAILRQDPDIIAVGEIRDGETAEIAMRAAITGHLVLSTIHTNDAVGTVDRLIDIGVDPYIVSSALRGIISQRLVRRICPHCREEYVPDLDELTQLHLGRETFGAQIPKFYRGAGCPHCYNTGYIGRIAVFEILQVTSKVRSAIAARLGREAVEEQIKEGSHFVPLRTNAIRLVLEGVTTSSEVLRVINEEE